VSKTAGSEQVDGCLASGSAHGRRPIRLATLIAALAISGCVVAGRPGLYVGGTVSFGPPAPYHEIIGVAPGPAFFWDSGYWSWGGTRYVWVPGRWVRRRPGYYWVPRRWVRDRDGWHADGGRWVRR
jgi:WXXGXW repeat (2 copies)